MSDSDTNPTRVLVIDDDPVALLVMAHILGQPGQLEVTTATGPGDALARLAEQVFDVVVTDVQMPGMTGLELLDQLTQASPNLPVVVVTADTGIDSALSAVRSRAAAFLFKPLDPQRLTAAVTRAAPGRAAATRQASSTEP